MAAWPTTPSDATHPFGTGLFWAAYGSTVGAAPAIGTSLGVAPAILGGIAVAGQPWAEIGLMTRVTAPERSSGDTKITHLKTVNKAHEYIPGYVEGGSLTFRLLHSTVSHQIIYSLSPNANVGEQRLAFAIQFADGICIYFNGYIKSYPVEVSDGDDPIAIDVTIKVSGDLRLVA